MSTWPVMPIGIRTFVGARHTGVYIPQILYDGVIYNVVDPNGYGPGGGSDVILFDVTADLPRHAKVFDGFTTAAFNNPDWSLSTVPTLSAADCIVLAGWEAADATPRWAPFTGLTLSLIGGLVYLYPKDTFDAGDPGFTNQPGDSGGPVFVRTNSGWYYIGHVFNLTGTTGGIFQMVFNGRSDNQSFIDSVSTRVDFDGGGGLFLEGEEPPPDPDPPAEPPAEPPPEEIPPTPPPSADPEVIVTASSCYRQSSLILSQQKALLLYAKMLELAAIGGTDYTDDLDGLLVASICPPAFENNIEAAYLSIAFNNAIAAGAVVPSTIAGKMISATCLTSIPMATLDQIELLLTSLLGVHATQ